MDVALLPSSSFRCFCLLKPGLYYSRWQSCGSLTVADSRVRIYTSADDCCLRKWATVVSSRRLYCVVFKVQQCWIFDAVATSRCHFPSNQRVATAFTRSQLMQTWRIKHLKWQICVFHRRSDYKSHRKKENSWKYIGEEIQRMVSIGQPAPNCVTPYPGIG